MQNYVDCPVCEASCPLEDDNGVGDELFCSFCGAVLVLKKGGGDRLRAVED